MKVFWSPSAEQDRSSIFDFISQDNPLAAIHLDEQFADAASGLKEHPMMGRSGQISGARELIPHEHYRMVYEVQGDTVWILALVHTARLWPPRQSKQ